MYTVYIVYTTNTLYVCVYIGIWWLPTPLNTIGYYNTDYSLIIYFTVPLFLAPQLILCYKMC
jgi:hypothetical protein